MELQQWKYFVCAVECGSIVKTSEKCFVTRQTISTALTQLENELGFSLLERGNNGVVPTEAGRLFYERIAGEFRELQQIEKEMREYSAHYRLPIKIGLAGNTDQWQVDVFERWIRQHPQYQAELIFLDGRQSNALLESGELNFCFTAMPNEASLTYTSEQVAEYPLMLAVHRENPLAGKTRITAEDFHTQKILCSTLGYGRLEYTGQKWMPFEREQNQICSEDQLYLFSLLAVNKGVMACNAYNTLLNQMRDICLIPFSEGYTFPYFLRTSSVTNRNRQYDEAARDLTAYLKHALRRNGFDRD